METLATGPKQRKSPWPFLTKASVSAVLLWLTLRHVRLQAVLTQIAAIDRVALLVALVTLVGATFVAAVRWTVILRALRMPRGMRVAYPITLIGLFFGQALPAGLGADVVRAWLVCKTGVPLRVAISSILGDRISGFLAILVIATIELPKLRATLGPTSLVEGVILVLGVSYSAIAIVMALDKVPQGLHRFHVVRAVASISRDLRAALLSWAGLLILSYGAVVQITNVLAVLSLAQGLHLQQATLASCLLIVPLANIAQSIPISVAGWGVRESFFVVAFGAVGVSAPGALAISVVFGLLVLTSSIPGAILWLVQRTSVPASLPEVA